MLPISRSSPPLPLPLPLPNFKTPRDAAQLHAHLITTGNHRHPSVLRLLSSSPHPPLRLLACHLLLSLRRPSPHIFNPLLQPPSSPTCILLTLSVMLSAPVPADAFSFSLALKACSRLRSLPVAAQIHSLILKSPTLSSHIYLHNSLITLYCKCGLPILARQLFDRMPHRDSVSWNSLIDGYVKNGLTSSAMELFNMMPESKRNLVTWNTIISGNTVNKINVARQLFDRMPERDVISWNLMVDGYAKCGMLEEAVGLFDRMPSRDVITWASLAAGCMESGMVSAARRLFDEMPQRDLIAWNIMIAGFVKNGYFTGALCFFNKMKVEGGVTPDSTTLASVLSAISELGRLRDGIAIHDYIRRKKLSLDGKLGVALIDMYSKCGRLREALRVFEISVRSVDHCNAMIGGLAIHGFGELALELFHEMEKLSIKPDDLTFIGILSACSHAGLVEEGLMCFGIMRREYNLEPKVQHYGCMVDILGRAGLLEEAWKMIEDMPVEQNDVVWRSLLSACSNHGDLELGRKVAKNLIERNPCSSSSFVLLSNLYAGLGLWGDVSEVRLAMRERDLRKVPGCSWIELDGVVHEFVVGDNSHPQAREIYSLLDELCKYSGIVNRFGY